ncbi:predicted protein (apicoplast) [Theileria equi strain WA]|uniref:Ribosomal protein L5 n=1 Tax=Theileria equi strain WA TaxID=1537102 RepID=L1L9X8_THEEQ|nr:predicted protein [Theileria equi strain WA]EKX71958.1 predicted protein [Theileria equi strain WA]|eukprot:XP_025033551.1 predicted protein (apicoplast) [Theileria equi strain WA]
MLTEKNLLKKIVVYAHTRRKKKTNSKFLTDITTCLHTITRQHPTFITNHKHIILGVQSTIRGKNLINFIRKLKLYTFPKFYSNKFINQKICSLDKNYNLNLTIKNQTYFFEYLATSLVETYYTFNVKFIFRNKIPSEKKIFYLTQNLQLSL